jgi:hypothetical protein
VAGAQVRVDLDDAPVACTAPCDLDLAPGRHTLIVSAPGHQVARREVVIEAQQRALARVELSAQTGSVVVNADERGALVEVDGRPGATKGAFGTNTDGKNEIVIYSEDGNVQVGVLPSPI